MKKRLLWLLPLLVLLLFPALMLRNGASTQPEEPYSLTLWYAADSEPLSEAFERLAQDYNTTREQGTLPVTLRAFSDEAALARTLENGAVPDLLLCSHALAFTLDERGLLKQSAVSAPLYAPWLTQRSESVGSGYYPIGFDVQVLCSAEPVPSSLPALLQAAQDYGAETGTPFLCVDAFAPLFYQVLLEQRTEFTADPDRDRFDQDYVNLYNQLAEAAFTHGLTAETALSVPCRLERGSQLRGHLPEGYTLRPLSEGELLAEGRGLAVTSREPRSQRDLPRFLRWLLEPERLASAALEAGLIPAAASAVSPADALDRALLAEYGRALHLPDGSSQYYVNRSSFEAYVRDAVELLH